jgi:hypothetical protein
MLRGFVGPATTSAAVGTALRRNTDRRILHQLAQLALAPLLAAKLIDGRDR